MNDTDRDVVAITQLVNLYGLAVDSQRWELFDRVFATDVDADYGATSHWTDREQFKDDFAAFHAPFDSTQHTMSTHVVHVDGDRALSFGNGGWRLLRTGRSAVTRSGTAPAGMTTPWCAPRVAGASPAGYAGSPGGPATRGSTKRSPG
jgi:hypothetical protein